MSFSEHMVEQKIDILSLLPEELEALAAKMGQPKFRGGQLFGWLHQKRVGSFDEMSNLPLAFREQLALSCVILLPRERKRQTSKDNSTAKLLFELYDKNTIESVLMRHDYGNSLCVSSQVGCRMGCKFCASTIGGKVRDLLPSEILGQIYAVAAITNERVDSVVMMGIGEPLDNYDNVLRFLDLVHHPKGLDLSHRHISLSTCGIVPKIKELADKKLQLTLSISLHACSNQTRDAIMPINHSYRIETLLAACKEYFAKTGRRISYEYSLISGINDSPEQAQQLLTLLKDQSCHVNLIPINPVEETDFVRSSKKDAEKFCKILNSGGISATIRREFGADIDAACGQLRRKDAKEGKTDDMALR